jgi:enterochelin esterase-like enzyme
VPSPSPVPPTGTSTATPLPPTATPGCADEQGSILQSELIDPDLPRSLPYRIYIPACVERSFGRLPTLYLLHGLSYTDSQWDDLGADEVAEQLIRLGVAQPFLIVMPWERLGLEYESTIVDYLVPFIEAEYGGSPDRALRAIGGISRGGGWALRIGMGHSDLFGAVGLHSPAVLVPDLFNLAGWIQAGPKPRLWIDIGDRDPLRFSVQDLTEQLDELNAEYQFTQFAGYHEPLYWSLHLEDYMRWYISNWN